MGEVAAGGSHRVCIGVPLRCIEVFLGLYVFLKLFLLSLLLLVDFLLQRLESFGYEDAPTLAASLRLCYKYNGWFVVGLFLGHAAIFNSLFTFSHFLLVILLNLTIFTWIKPRPWEKVVMVWELFLESFQVDAQGVLAGYVVHAKKMVNSLVR